MRHAVDPEHRKPVLLVVVAGVVAERPFERVQVAARSPWSRHAVLAFAGEPGRREAGCGLRARSRHCAGTCSFDAAFADRRCRRPRCGRRAAGRRTGIRDRLSGTGVTAPRIVAGSAPSATAIGNGWPGLARAKSRKSSAPPRWASQRMMTSRRADHLLAVDAQVLPRRAAAARCGPARDDQAPGDQRPGVAGPAGLDRQRARSMSLAFAAPPPGTARCARRAGFMSHSALAICHQAAGILEALAAARAPSGCASTRPTSRKPAQARRRPCPGPRAAACRTGWPAPEICKRPRVGFRTAVPGPPARSTRSAERCHLEPRGHRLGDPSQFADALQLRHEVAQVAVFHAIS